MNDKRRQGGKGRKGSGGKTNGDPKRAKRGGASRSRDRRNRRDQHLSAEADFSPSRRALSQRGLPTKSRGDAQIVEVFEAAFEAMDEDHDLLTHAFHSYPARMHPLLVRQCFSLMDGDVLDPFCGSGTVLVEAMRAGRRAVGVDINPLAVRIAEVKTAKMNASAREAFLVFAESIAERSEERVRTRVPVRADLPREEIAWYSPHTLKELAGLLEEIRNVEDPRLVRFFEVVFSSLLVKFSKQRADTANAMVEKRIRKGLPTEFFLRKCRELAQRWAELEEEADKSAPEPRARVGDVKRLSTALPKGFAADLVITSPPYGGTYDYVDHHKRRYPWLGLDTRAFEKEEIGARRRSDQKGGRRRWNRELGQTLAQIADALKPGGLAVLLIGDGLIGGTLVPADEQVLELSESISLTMVASASTPRDDWHGEGVRAEHLIALRRDA